MRANLPILSPSERTALKMLGIRPPILLRSREVENYRLLLKRTGITPRILRTYRNPRQLKAVVQLLSVCERAGLKKTS